MRQKTIATITRITKIFSLLVVLFHLVLFCFSGLPDYMYWCYICAPLHIPLLCWYENPTLHCSCFWSDRDGLKYANVILLLLLCESWTDQLVLPLDDIDFCSYKISHHRQAWLRAAFWVGCLPISLQWLVCIQIILGAIDLKTAVESCELNQQKPCHSNSL